MSNYKGWFCLVFLLGIVNSSEVKSESETGPRIINGENANAGDYPWFARGVYSYSYGTWWGCGGSLVTPEFVLSAAHCSWSTSSAFQIGALCSPYGSDADDNCGQTVETLNAIRVFNHPSYNSWTTSNDFSLIQLDGQSSVTPVPMDHGNVSSTYIGGEKVWAAGFGNTELGYPSSSLKHVEVSYVTTDTCNSYSSYNGAVDDSMMCAADPNEDSCQGDSGGPLYDKLNNTLVGITSWGHGCAEANKPGVYSRIGDQWLWIWETICEHHSMMNFPAFCDGYSRAPTPSPSTIPSAIPSLSAVPSLSMIPSDSPTFGPPRNILVKYWEAPTDWMSLPDYSLEESLGAPYKTEYIELINFVSSDDTFIGSGRRTDVAASFEGTLQFKGAGTYTICLSSDDGSRLYMDGELFLDADGLYSKTRCDDYEVSSDKSELLIEYWQRSSSSMIYLYWRMPGSSSYEYIPGHAFVRLTEEPSISPVPSVSMRPSGQPTMSPVPTAYPSSTPSEEPSVSSQPSTVSSHVPSISPCEESSVILQLKTDNWAHEISWVITRLIDGDVYAQASYKSMDDRTFFEYYFCIESTVCHRFEISDSMGDGLIESQGGFYNLTVDGNLIASSLDGFTSTEKATFGCTPTEAPTLEPTPTPTISPTFSPCDNGQTAILKIKLDYYAYETSWSLVNTMNDDIIEQAYYSSGDAYGYFEYKFCIEGCYTFSIFDSYGDGIYESHGGYYNLYLDGEVVSTSLDHYNGNFAYMDEYTFACSVIPTVEPTAEPTVEPTKDPSQSPSKSSSPSTSSYPSQMPSTSSAPSTSPYPTSSHLIPLDWFGWTPYFLLQECSGDCDYDSDCAPGLQCFHRHYYDDAIPPGCVGSPHDDINAADYCYDPAKGLPTSDPTPTQSLTYNPTSEGPINVEVWENVDLYNLPSSGLSALGLPSFAMSVDSVNFVIHDWQTVPFFSGTDLHDHFAVRFSGYLNFYAEGDYELCITSDDGSALYMDDESLLSNDGLHDDQTICTDVYHSSGVHHIVIEYFESQGGATMIFSWKTPTQSRRVPVPSYAWVPSYSPQDSSCSGSILTLKLKTDTYPEETSWTLSNTEFEDVIAGFTYTENDADTTFDYRFCVKESVCMQFIIRDECGDGLYSFDGVNGFYSLWLDEELISTGRDDDFGYYESVNIGNCEEIPTMEPTTSDSLIKSLEKVTCSVILLVIWWSA